MKNKAGQLLTGFALFLVPLLGVNFAEAKPCAECKKILALKDEYVNTQAQPGLAHDQSANKITAIIQSARRQADGRLSDPMIDAIVEILRVEKDSWFRQLFVEKNLTMFKDNREQIGARLGRIPKAEAEDIQEDIDIKLHEMEFGNDPKTPRKKSLAAKD